MTDDNKAVGPLAAAKQVALTKAALEKKLDKTGGTITGSLDVKSSIDADGYIHSGLALLAPSLWLNNDAEEATVFINCSGDNAARITSLSSDGKSHYSRFAVGTPTGDNDAATKAYVDNHAAGYEVITVTSTNVSDLGYDASEGANRYSVTFDASFDSILANLAANKPMKFNITLPDSIGGFPVSFSTGYVSALNDIDYLFTGTILKYPVVLRIGALGSATVYLYGAYLPEPNPDDSDDGKSLVVNGHKWTMKKAAVDDAMSNTSTNPVQNKVIKQYVDNNAAGAGAVRYDAAQSLTFEQKNRARLNIGALSSELPVTTGPVSMCPANVTDSYDAVHVTTTKHSGDDFTLTIDCGPENALVRVYGIRTPTDTETNAAANVEYVKAKIAEAAASGGVDVDNALSATSTNPVQNKVVTAALTGKAGTAVATTSANGLMSKADKAKLDGIAAGATQVTIDSAMSGSSNNPVANHVVKQYVDDKVAAAGSNITVDTSLSSTSTNPVQNKAVKAAIDAKADKTALDGKLDKAGGTLTGNLTGKYITGTWLQSTAAANLGKTPGKIAVLDESGWVYYRTPAELKSDIGASSGGADVSTVLDKVYPVGAIYMSVNSANPKTLFGGTWVQIKDRFLLAAGTTYKAGATGGEATHTLTTSEMPSHNHAVYYPNTGAADHSAPGNYPDGPSDSTYYAVGSYTSSAGGGGAHNNMPPYLSVYVWKRTA